VTVNATFRVQPVEHVGGELRVPGDKSISHRALMLGAVAQGTSEVSGFLASEDCRATRAAVEALGVRVEDTGDGRMQVHGVGLDGLCAPARPLDLGNSGTAIRLLTGLLAGQPFDTELTGDESLRTRPMERVAEPLRAMGAKIATTDGRAPIRLGRCTGLNGISYRLPVASAQVKSALLLAGLQARGRTILWSPGPSRDHTERMLLAMGVALEQDPAGQCVSLEGPATLKAMQIEVPGDFSSAAFFIVAACLGAVDGLVLRDVGVNPTRIGLMTALNAMGARIELRHMRRRGAEPVADIHVERSALHGIDLPPEWVPLAIDEFPILFVAAAAASGETCVRGAEELRHKESDRIAVMARGLAALGGDVRELPDGLIIRGGRLSGGKVDSCGDHRIAMSFAIASLIADGPIDIANTAQVATSFPGFIATANACGLRIEGSDGSGA
jgi:3-phosphoshikimate 1-carboxyvinyltransferase